MRVARVGTGVFRITELERTMAKGKAQPSQSAQARFSSVTEIRQHIAKLAERIEQVQELLKEGLPYIDAMQVKVELAVRETIREIFGDKSSEFQDYGGLTINATSRPAIARTITVLQYLIQSLEGEEATLLGKPRPPRRSPPTIDIDETDHSGENTSQPEIKSPRGAPPRSAASAGAKRPSAPSAEAAAAAAAVAAQRQCPPPAMEPRHQPAPPPPSPVEAATNLGDALARIRTICTRFHGVVRQLRERSEGRPPFEVEDEFDVRDLLQALLHVEFDEVVPEEWAPPRTGGSTQVDVIVHPFGVVIVSTKTRRGMGASEITDFWTAAAKRYTGRADCRSLFGFIYDPEGRIGTPRRLEADLMGIDTRGKGEVHILPK